MSWEPCLLRSVMRTIFVNPFGEYWLGPDHGECGTHSCLLAAVKIDTSENWCPLWRLMDQAAREFLMRVRGAEAEKVNTLAKREAASLKSRIQ